MGGEIPDNQSENLSNPDNIRESYSAKKEKVLKKTREELLKDSPDIINLATPSREATVQDDAKRDDERVIGEWEAAQKAAQKNDRYRGNVAFERKKIVDDFLAQELAKELGKKHELYDARKYPQIQNKADYLRRQYGIGIVYGKDYEGDNVKIRKSSPSNDIIALDKLCKAINLLPRELTKKFEGLTIVLGSKIKDGADSTLDGIYIVTPQEQVIGLISLNPEGESVFFHELFHSLDWKFNKSTSDDDEWMKKSGTKKGDYVGKKYFKEADQPEGFSKQYGKSNVLEDQATIAEELFNKKSINDLFDRAKTDIKLRVKVGLITACLFDVETGRFSRVMTEAEYTKFSGFRNYKYFYAWSDGRMDHKYWNAIADGNPGRY